MSAPSTRLVTLEPACGQRLSFFFLAVPYAGRVKGNVKFQGLGVIDKVEVVSQWDRHAAKTFANYRFDAVILSLASENEKLRLVLDQRSPRPRRYPSKIRSRSRLSRGAVG